MKRSGDSLRKGAPAESKGGQAAATAKLLVQMPACCTYDQVYRRIIELLNATSARGARPDPTLSRALLDELEVSYVSLLYLAD